MWIASFQKATRTYIYGHTHTHTEEFLHVCSGTESGDFHEENKNQRWASRAREQINNQCI